MSFLPEIVISIVSTVIGGLIHSRIDRDTGGIIKFAKKYWWHSLATFTLVFLLSNTIIDHLQPTNDDNIYTAIPAGAVVAFDTPSGCPTNGWVDIGEKLLGKVIVGATANTNQKYGFGRTGGNESIKIEEDQLPAHTHDVNDPGHSHQVPGVIYSPDTPGYYDQASTSRGASTLGALTGITIEKSGGKGAEINIMPPYVSLFYCRKT